MKTTDLTGNLADYRAMAPTGDVGALHQFLEQKGRWAIATCGTTGIPTRAILASYLAAGSLDVWDIVPQGGARAVGGLLWSRVYNVAYAHVWFHHDAWDTALLADALETAAHRHFGDPTHISPLVGAYGLSTALFLPLPPEVERAVLDSGFDPGGGPLNQCRPDAAYFYMEPSTYAAYYGAAP